VQVQRIPHNNGGAVSGPVTVQDQVVTLTGNATTVTIANNTITDAYTITLLPSSTPTSPPPTTPPPTTPPPTSPTPSVPPSSPPASGTACGAAYQVVSTWPGGFQADVAVTNTGSAATRGWQVSWALASGQTVNQSWNGSPTVSGGTVTVTNASYNGALAPGAGTTFGLLVSGSSAGTPTLTCSAT
jgi:hypothetical protein